MDARTGRGHRGGPKVTRGSFSMSTGTSSSRLSAYLKHEKRAGILFLLPALFFIAIFSYFSFFVTFFLLHGFASLYSSPPSVFLWHRGCSDAFLGSNALFSRLRRHLLRSFHCFDMAGLHPDVAGANLSRPIPSRMSRNNSRGTATSAIWKIICRAWRTTFAPILINFSRNVVNVQ